MPVRWDTVQVDGKPMRVYIGVPEGEPRRVRILVAQHAARYRERPARGSWSEMLASFSQHLKL